MESNAFDLSPGLFPGPTVINTHHPAVGLPLGGVVLTSDGALPIEYLSPGDRVISRDTGYVRLLDLWPVSACAPAVRVHAGVLKRAGHKAPVVLPASYRVRLPGSSELIELAHLVDGQRVTDLGIRPMSLLCPIFDAAAVIYVSGLMLHVPAQTKEQTRLS